MINTDDLLFDRAPWFRASETVTARQAEQDEVVYEYDEFGLDEDELALYGDYNENGIEVLTGQWVLHHADGISVMDDSAFQELYVEEDGVYRRNEDPVQAIRFTEKDELIQADGEIVEIHPGDVAIRCSDGTTEHKSRSNFVSSYNRATADGTDLTHQYSHLHRQARELKRLLQENPDLKEDVDSHIADLMELRDVTIAIGESGNDCPDEDGNELPSFASKHVYADSLLLDLVLNRTSNDEISNEQAREIADEASALLPAPEDADLVEVTPENLPVMIERMLGDNDIDDIGHNGWMQLKRTPAYREMEIRGLGRSLFKNYTSVPLEEVQAMGGMVGSSEIERRKEWIREHGRVHRRENLTDFPSMPGYSAHTEVWAVGDVEFLLVEDYMNRGEQKVPMSNSIYAWPARTPVLDTMQEASAKVDAADALEPRR